MDLIMNVNLSVLNLKKDYKKFPSFYNWLPKSKEWLNLKNYMIKSKKK